jgi:hypothetical protein
MWFSVCYPTVHVPYVDLQLETLLKLFPVAGYRNLTLQCLSEASVVTSHLKFLFCSFVFALPLFLVQNVMLVLVYVVVD